MRIDPHQFTVECLHDFAEAEAAWRELEGIGITSVYQRMVWTTTWHRHIGSRIGIEPVIVVGRLMGRPVFVWPMGVRRVGPLRIGHWLGGSHANYNFGIYDPAASPAFSQRQLAVVLADVANAARIDCFVLRNQPRHWCDQENPFVTLPSQPAPSNAMSVALAPDYDEHLKRTRSSKSRRKLRRKERRYHEAGDAQIVKAGSEQQVREIMTAFADQKAVQFSARGIHNVFAEPGVQEFFIDLAIRSLDMDEPAVEIHALYLDGAIRAIWAGGIACNRFSGMFNSLSLDDRTALSPGTVLLSAVVEHCCQRGIKEFDLGVGDVDYKRLWCDTVDELFDTIYPTSAAGRAAAPIIRRFLTLKRFAKNKPRIREGYRRSRRILNLR